MPKLKTTPPVCRAYPRVFEHTAGYLVSRANKTLYWGHSIHVARLIANTMTGAQCV